MGFTRSTQQTRITGFSGRANQQTGITGFSSRAEQRTTQPSVQSLKEYGYDVPGDKGWSLFGKKFLNTLGGVLDVLRTGEYAMGGILEEANPIKGIKEKISPSEALDIRKEETDLWSARGLAGLATDILLDPTTYLTFGTAGAMKIATKGGQIAIKKSGQKLMRDMIEKGASEAAARRAMARVIQEGGEKAAEKYVGKRGLKFMGQVFIPAENFQRVGKMINKLPGAATVNKVGNGLAKAFVPFREIDKMPAKIGGKGTYTDFLYKPFERETQTEIFRGIDEVKKNAQKAMDEYGVDVGTKIGHKAERGKLTGDKMLDTIIKAHQKDMDTMLKVERATGKKVGKIDNYLRHYLTDEGRDFLEKGNDFYAAMPKALKAKLQAATPRKFAGTVRQINGHFREQYGIQNFFEPDLFKAWAKRKAEHIKYVNTYNFLEATKARFGVRLDKAKSTFTEGGVKLVEPTNPQLKGWLLPEPITKHLDDTLRFLTKEDSMRGFLKVYDKMMAFWKKNVTGIWPAFHTRNFLGGSYNNWLAGVKPLDYKDTEQLLHGSDKTLKTAIGTKYTGKQIIDLAERYGVRGQPGMMDVYRGVDDAIKEVAATPGKKALIKTSNAPRWMMEQVEDRLRLPLFINRLKKGYSPSGAAKDVFKYHFDYMPKTGLSKFEQDWMRRIMPFYVWTRNNIPLQLEQMMKQPGKYAGLEKFRKSIFDKEDQKEFDYLPDWMKEMFIAPLPWKDEAGRSLWMQLDLPLEDINKLPITSSGIREIASMLTPFLKFPAERYMNRNFYFGGDIWNPDVNKDMQTRKATEALKHLPGPIKKFLNFREVQYRDWNYPEEKRFLTRYEMDARKLHILNSFLGRYYSTLRGVSDEDIPAEWRASRYVGGVPVRPIDIEEEKQDREYEQERQAREMLRYLKQHNIIPYKSEQKEQLF